MKQSKVCPKCGCHDCPHRSCGYGEKLIDSRDPYQLREKPEKKS